MLGYLSPTPVCCGCWVSHNNDKNKSDKNNLNLKHNLKIEKSCSVYLQDIASHVKTVSDLNKLCGDGSAKCIYKSKIERF